MARLRDARHRSHREDRIAHIYDIGESNARQSEYYAAHMDESNVDVPECCAYCRNESTKEFSPYCSQECATLAECGI